MPLLNVLEQRGYVPQDEPGPLGSDWFDLTVPRTGTLRVAAYGARRR